MATSHNTNNSSEERWWFGKALVFGLLFGIALLALGHWMPAVESRNTYVALAMTGGVAWSVLTTFRREWGRREFWGVVSVLFVLHLSLMWVLVVSRPTSADLRHALLIGIPEVIVMMVAILYARAKNYFST